ncbi:MAG TPA: TetR/AcrR family transcriptional regulator [Candidatus Saccharimonadales bacterium]|nr:TetR/AcrR family transcriptional regulator [Candidatus Saccharimonadales bacterium]
MSNKHPRPSRTEVKSSIIQTAREIAATEGWAAVTVRKVAQNIGYTAPIIYEHFGSKDEMLNQVLKYGYDLLHDDMVRSVEKETDNEQRVRAIVMAYWDFAHRTPELYQLMYGMEGARATSEAARDFASPMVAFITSELIRYSPSRITANNVARIMVEAWSFVHGMIALDVSGYTVRFVKSDDLPEVLTGNVMEILRRQ